MYGSPKYHGLDQAETAVASLSRCEETGICGPFADEENGIGTCPHCGKRVHIASELLKWENRVWASIFGIV